MKATSFSFVLLILFVPTTAWSFEDDSVVLGLCDSVDVGPDNIWFAFQFEDITFPSYHNSYQYRSDEYENWSQETESPEVVSDPLLSSEDNPQFDFETTDNAGICFVDISPSSNIYIHCN